MDVTHRHYDDVEYKKGAEAVQTLVVGLERDQRTLHHEHLRLTHTPPPYLCRICPYRVRHADRGAADARDLRHLGARACLHGAGGKADVMAVPAQRSASGWRRCSRIAPSCRKACKRG